MDLIDNLKLLPRLLWRPGGAVSAILDQGSLLFASAAVLVISIFLKPPLANALPWVSFRFYTPLLVLAVIYAPGTLLITALVARLSGGLGAIFQRDYSSLLTCASMAWVATNLPLIFAAWLLPTFILGSLAGIAYVYFGIIMFFAVRAAFGVENGAAALVVGLSWLPLAAAVLLWGPFQLLLGWLASPFFLFYAYYYLGAEIGNLGSGMRSRQNFRRMLEAAAINPHDGEAQYQLGLIYQQRHQYTEAIRRFRNAVAIDPAETDAHFQLGRIAREQGRFQDALGHFQTVVDQNEKHNQSEVLRELGAIYLSAGQYRDACNELATYTDRRPYDPEGLFYYGQALEGMGRLAEAREIYERAVEAARTAPRYRRRFTAKWSRLAGKQIRKLASQAGQLT